MRGSDGIDVLSPDQGRRLRPYLGRRRSMIDGNVEAAGAYQEFAIPIIVDRRIVPPYAFRVYIPGLPSIAQLALVIRPGQVADAQSNDFTGVGAIPAAFIGRYPVADVADDPTNSAAQSVTFVLGDNAPVLEKGVAYFFTVTGDGSNLAWANALVPPAGSTPVQRGFYKMNNAWNTVGSSIAIAFDFFESVSVPDKERLPPKLLSLTEDRPSAPFWPNLSYPLQKVEIEITGQPIVIPAQTLVFEAPATAAVSAYQSRLSTDSYPLTHQGIVENSETVTLGGTPLTRGTDYVIDYARGTIRTPRSDLFGFPTVTYRAALERLDYVVVETETGALSVVKGAERGTDTVEYPPGVPPGTILLYAANVTTASVEVTRAG